MAYQMTESDLARVEAIAADFPPLNDSQRNAIQAAFAGLWSKPNPEPKRSARTVRLERLAALLEEETDD